MTEAQAVEAILQHWKTGWGELYPTVAYTIEDEVVEAVEEFVRISVIPTLRENGAIGGTRLVNEGFISVQIFTRPRTGSQRANQLADAVREVFENVSIPSPLIGDEPVCVYAGPSSAGQPTNDGAWKMKLVNHRYRYDDVGGDFEEGTLPTNLNTQNFRYTVTSVASSYTITLPAERADTNYRVGWSIADADYTVSGQVPIASRTTTQFVFAPDAPLAIDDVLEFTVEDLT